MHANLKSGFSLSRSAPLSSVILGIHNEKEVRKANMREGSKIDLQGANLKEGGGKGDE